MTTDPRPLSAEAPLSASEEVEVRERARLGSVVWVGMRVPRIFATLDAERARLRSATRRYEDAEHNMLLLNDDLIAERARHAALVEAATKAKDWIVAMDGDRRRLPGAGKRGIMSDNKEVDRNGD